MRLTHATHTTACLHAGNTTTGTLSQHTTHSLSVNTVVSRSTRLTTRHKGHCFAGRRSGWATVMCVQGASQPTTMHRDPSGITSVSARSRYGAGDNPHSILPWPTRLQFPHMCPDVTCVSANRHPRTLHLCMRVASWRHIFTPAGEDARLSSVLGQLLPASCTP